MNNNWTREETIIAFNVYCKIPFKCSSKAHPLVVKYAHIIGRSPSALNMKIGNIGRLDPDLKRQGISGLTHGAKEELAVWNEFYRDPERLAFESERLIAQFAGKAIEDSLDTSLKGLPPGEEREAVIKQRVNQSFFRAAVTSSYNFRCCISGIQNEKIVEACHIIEWSQDVANRTNPHNGLCLNPFFHKAYDKLLVSITPDFDIVISDSLIENTDCLATRDYLSQLNGTKITLPDRFPPKKDLLALHHDKYLQSL